METAPVRVDDNRRSEFTFARRRVAHGNITSSALNPVTTAYHAATTAARRRWWWWGAAVRIIEIQDDRVPPIAVPASLLIHNSAAPERTYGGPRSSRLPSIRRLDYRLADSSTSG